MALVKGAGIPYLPLEVKALIVAFLSESKDDKQTLCRVKDANRDFAHLIRPIIYQHVDFRGKSENAIRVYAEFVAPSFGYLTTSIAHRPVEEGNLTNFGAKEQLDYMANWDVLYTKVLKELMNVSALDLTIPELAYQSMYASTWNLLLKWKNLEHLTLRSRKWGRGLFCSAEDSYNARAIAVCLSAFQGLRTFRALGITGLDLSPGGPSLREFDSIKSLNLQALHIAGGWLTEFMPHVIRLAPPLTHLTVAEDTELHWEDLKPLLLSVSPTLESLAIRQSGTMIDDSLSDDGASLESRDFLCLKRLVLSLQYQVPLFLKKFYKVGLHKLEIGSDDEGLDKSITGILQAGIWPHLREVAVVTTVSSLESWSAFHEICERRKIVMEPGYLKEEDFPPKPRISGINQKHVEE